MDVGEKVAKLDLSHQASEQFGKFLYDGFDLDLDFDLDDVTELVFYAGVCGSLSSLWKNRIESEYALNFVTGNFDKSLLTK